MAQRQWRGAADDFLAIVEHAPHHVPALLKAADALLALDRYRQARECVLDASRVPVRHPGLRVDLARRLRLFNDFEPLFDIARGTFADGNAPVLIEMASLASAAGEQSLARELVDRAIGQDATRARAHYLDGVLAMFEGDPARAETALNTSLGLSPAFAQAHWMLSGIRPWGEDEHHVGRLRQCIARVEAGSNDEAYLAYALHNELHALKRHDEAWQALERGHAAKRRRVPYDAARTDRLFDAVEAAWARELPLARGDGESMAADSTPIFIVGLHRSGTTLLERILGGHSRVADGGETYAFTAQLALAADHRIDGALDAVAVERLRDADFDAIGAGYLAASTWRRRGRPCFTEKLPSNFLNAGFIARALPGARILHMTRDPADTCFSILRTYFNHAAHAFDQASLAHYHGRYRRLMRHWHAAMPGRVLDVAYDDLVNDTETTARRVFAFCGLPFEPGALAIDRAGGTVATASHAHVRDGILRDRRRKWAPYESHLRPLLDGLRKEGNRP